MLLIVGMTLSNVTGIYAESVSNQTIGNLTTNTSDVQSVTDNTTVSSLNTTVKNTTATATNNTTVSKVTALKTSALTSDVTSTDGNSTDGNSTDGNSTDGNSTDGNSTDGNLSDSTVTNLSSTLAAGSSSSSKNVISITNIEDAASRVAAFVLANHRLPNYVTISGVQIQMPEFLNLLVKALLNINSGTNSSVTSDNFTSPSKSSENITSGNIYSSQYLKMASSIASFMESNGRAPNYASSTLGNVGYESLVYMYSKILCFVSQNNRLPNYVSVESWKTLTNSTTSASSTTTSSNNSSTISDVLAPTVKSVDPVNKAVSVAVDKVIKVTFSESIKSGSGWIELVTSNGTVVPITWSISGKVLTVTPSSSLSKGIKYLLLIHTGSVTDLTGNKVAAYVSCFTTSTDKVAPTVKAVDPVNNAVSVAVSKVIKVTFSESIKTGTGWIELVTNNGTVVPITWSINGKVLTVTPSSSLSKGIKYLLLIHTGSVTDLAGNKVAGYVSRFTTVSTSTTSTTSTISAALKAYLQATTNCQSTNAKIVALSKSIIASAGATTTYAKAVAIFNWVRDNIGYSFYSNTKYGALGTLNAKTGNCVDTTHLLIALERAAGIPARYVHGYCKFSSGSWYGHVWAQVYVNGKWYTADAISSRNTFGVINNWNTATATIYGTYATLPF
jgi:transglutaminase-like putative cysteine protease